MGQHDLIALLVIVFLMGYSVLREWLNGKIQADLLDRLMAKDFNELTANQIERRKARVPDKIRGQEGIEI